MQLIRKLAPMCMHRSNVPVKQGCDFDVSRYRIVNARGQ